MRTDSAPHLAIIGLPGSGKSTLTHRLAAVSGSDVFSLGHVLREAAASGDATAADLIAQGAPVPGPLFESLVMPWLTRRGDSRGFVFDGTPRTGEQVEILAGIQETRHLEVVLLELPASVAAERLRQRALETPQVLLRADDAHELIPQRIARQSADLHDTIAACCQWWRLRRLDAQQETDALFAELQRSH